MPYAPKQSDRPSPVEGDEPGFTSIFDGQSLAGWEGDPTYWRVENGTLVGEITPATVVKSNTFIIGAAGAQGLRAQARLPHHRRRQQRDQLPQRQRARPGHPGQPVRPARLSVRHRRTRRYVGNNYEEKGRLFMAVRGQVTRVVGDPAAGGRRHVRRRSPARHPRDRRLECRPPDRPRQHPHPRAERAADERDHRRRRREPPGRRVARRAGARRSADEGRVPQHPAQDLVEAGRQGTKGRGVPHSPALRTSRSISQQATHEAAATLQNAHTTPGCRPRNRNSTPFAPPRNASGSRVKKMAAAKNSVRRRSPAASASAPAARRRRAALPARRAGRRPAPRPGPFPARRPPSPRRPARAGPAPQSGPACRRTPRRPGRGSTNRSGRRRSRSWESPGRGERGAQPGARPMDADLDGRQ